MLVGGARTRMLMYVRVHVRIARATMALWRIGHGFTKQSWLPIVATRATSWWSHVEQGPPDAIFGLVEAFKKDPRPEKISLAIGAYRDANNKPFVLPTVKKAEADLLSQDLDKEYAGITGYETFQHSAAVLAFGKNCSQIDNKLYVTAQTVSGTGSLRLAGMFLEKFWPGSKTIYLPAPSWPNHKPVFSSSGLEVKSYSYYDSSTCGLDSSGLYNDLNSLPEKSIVLFHACAHNPTGVDPKISEWKEISKICKERNHYVVVDMAYQGFATGNLDADAAGLRQLVSDGHNVMLCQSFSKNMGLYGERVGATTILCSDADEVKRVESQLKIIIRPLYSNPPIHGARIATHILNTPSLYNEWLGELELMAGRIMEMRQALKDGLINEGSTRNWSHITEQIGMFCYSGMTGQQVAQLQSDYGIFMTKDGRISMVSLTPGNVGAVAHAMHQVTK